MRTERLTNKHYKRFHLYIYTWVNFWNGNTFSSNFSYLTDQLITHKLRTRKWNYLFQLDLFSICTPAIRKTFAKVENTRNFLLEFFIYINIRLSIDSWTSLFWLPTSFWSSPLWYNQSLRPKSGTFYSIRRNITYMKKFITMI